MHATNHPGTLHLCESVFDVTPFRPHGRDIDLLWLSPDCKHFSRAKGGKPLSKDIRGLAWIAVHWASYVKPRVICLENVPEFLTWGPLYPDDHPVEKLRNTIITERKGETFYAFVDELIDLGYEVEWRELVAADYGAPTTRKRLFLIARCDGQSIRWPKKTHGPGRKFPHKTAAECIDWSLPCPSIFLSKEEARKHGVRRPLADKTLARIAEGIRRYVVEADNPYLVPDGVATMIQTGYGERKGQRPRALNIQQPLGTVVAGGSKHALITAFLAKHYTGVIGTPMTKPIGTVTAKDHHSVVAAHLTKFYGTSKSGANIQNPMPTVTARSGGGHMGLVAAFLTKYYGTGGQLQSVAGPMHTIVSKARFGLVTVELNGEPYVITDIGMRMLQPRELARAQGFGEDYILTGTKTAQIARIGNSVPPPVVEAIVRAQFVRRPVSRANRLRRVA
jgi:DNA (cytosine-5)-methyltransferase 1